MKRVFCVIAMATASLCNAAQAAGPCLIIAEAEGGAGKTQVATEAELARFRNGNIGVLRSRVTWRTQQPDEELIFDNEDWLKNAARLGFRLKLQLAIISEPPAWFLERNANARVVGADGDYSRNMVSPWYPRLHKLILDKTDRMVHGLAGLKLLPIVDWLILDLGPAGEPIYPAAWTRGAGVTKEQFWFYGTAAVASFHRAMKEKYVTVTVANAKWGTSYNSWAAIPMPREAQTKGAIWIDVLEWYASSKEEYIQWQILAARQALQKYSPGRKIQLVMLVPGNPPSNSQRKEAANGTKLSAAIKLSIDYDFLVAMAKKYDLVLQYTALPDLNGLGILRRALKNDGISVWGENVGDPETAARLSELSASIKDAKLAGFDYVSSRYLSPTSERPVQDLWRSFNDKLGWVSGCSISRR